ncbi:Uncharacterised protein [Enterobacter asburiae]|uniref:Uncharacterized protein n=1 Tax=Enterobacter asburiae TaxID=61645 RepID=A0A376FKA8_ENTAS|nr:Uncharacterised protein [Enterobacter asburiae]
MPEGEQVALWRVEPQCKKSPRLTTTITVAASSPGSNQPGINGWTARCHSLTHAARCAATCCGENSSEGVWFGQLLENLRAG